MLDGLGFRVIAVSDGATAIEQAAERVFDVALVHVNLPVLNGAQCREAIAGLPGRHGRAAVAALLPAGTDAAQQQRQHLDRFAAVFELPFDADSVGRRLRDLVPAGDAAPVVDLEHLHRYTLGDESLERALFDEFLPSAARYIEQLAGAGDGADWSRTAHALKGAARGIGAFDLGDLAARAEAELPTLAGRDSALDELRRALGAVQRFVDARRNHPG